MEDNTTQSGKSPKQPKHPEYPGDNPRGDAKDKVAVDPRTTPKPSPITIKGQKYVAPPGRHSQQTHRRAEERALAQGHATEKEQHAHDRDVVKAELNRRAAQQLKQQESKQK